MKNQVLLLAAVVAVGCTHGGRPETEATLTAALSGRVAGAAQECVNGRDLSSEPYGARVILFGDPTDEVVYVNRPPAGCVGLAPGRGLTVRTSSTRLCRGDIAMVFDPASGTELGGCALGAFTPYRRAVPPRNR